MKSVVLVNDTTTQMHHGCELVMKQIRLLLGKRGIKVLATSAEGTDWRCDQAFLTAAARCDAIIVNGEGTIHHNRPAGRKLLEVTELAEQHRIPAFLINTTYQDNPPEFKQYLDKFSAIFVREGESAKALAKIAVPSTVVPDITLSYDYQPYSERKQIGVSDSSITPIAKKLFALCRENKALFLPVLRSSKYDGVFNFTERLRDLKFELTKLKLKLTGAEDYLQLRNLFVKKSIKQFFDAVASCHVVVSGRFHVICFCMLTETPFLGIDGNSHKIQSMLNDIGLSPDRIIAEDDIAAISMQSNYAYTQAELAALRAFKLQAKAGINNMFDIIAQTINGRPLPAAKSVSALHPNG
ncbi:polysaccharide pyruvyl transferase family protein [Rheinheimera nanhaiensis]|uniref:Polysaccharide pyruvyl transferase domain-containing protein n=1 Tax=Rheinheimera nanhaiensis E407-8 TaxID=562729 RepID=I1E331_9GAMM|nr:polysaccharide pyruvyl transferase family protein [Rheinheimera nanhaiensis]GAB60709.1 hypothetical protein RNAN_3735 [Rheinheimera nanhaiensis E407-8]